MDGLETFQHSNSSRLLAPKTDRLDKRQSSQSIPLQAPMRGKRCARRYMQTLPCTSPNSAAIYRRNCREQLSMVAPLHVLFDVAASHLQLVAFLLTPQE
jgi:hypothetical protein